MEILVHIFFYIPRYQQIRFFSNSGKTRRKITIMSSMTVHGYVKYFYEYNRRDKKKVTLTDSQNI